MSESEREREVREGKEGVTETQAKRGGSHHLHTILNHDSPLSPLICFTVLLVTGHHLCRVGLKLPVLYFHHCIGGCFDQGCIHFLLRNVWAGWKTFIHLRGHLEGDSIWRSCVGVSDTEKETWQGTSWLGCSITYYYHCSSWLVSWV